MICSLMGKARVGKSTFAEFLIDEFTLRGKHYYQIAFADELKRMCMELFKLEYDQLWGDRKEYTDLRFVKNHFGVSSNPADYWSAREIMQEVGEFFRKIDYDFWVKKVDEKIKGCDDWIITDVRHLNEADYTRDKGFLINIVRKNAEEIHGMSHESETALDKYEDYDLLIENDGTLLDLRTAAKDAVDFMEKIERMRGESKNG